MANRARHFRNIALAEGYQVESIQARSKHYIMVAWTPDGRSMRHILSKGSTSERSRTVDNFRANLRRFMRSPQRDPVNAFTGAM